MCVTFLAISDSNAEFITGKYKLVLLNNRDEEFDRSTSPLTWKNGILGGWDEEAEERGTWLGVDKLGRIANLLAITQPKHLVNKEAPSRGRLVNDFLTNAESKAYDFLSQLTDRSKQFNGFQMVALEIINGIYELYSLTNRIGPNKPMNWKGKGVYAFGNSPPQIPFQKVRYGKMRLRKFLDKAANITEDDLVKGLFELASDRTIHFPDEQIRIQTGAPVDSDAYKFLCSIFVDGTTQGRQYGTRSSSVILVDNDDNVVFHERRMLDPSRLMDDPKKWAFSTERFSFKK